jgi:hypothetical protein
MKKKTHYENKNKEAACGAMVTSRYLTRTPKSVDCPKCKEKLEK